MNSLEAFIAAAKQQGASDEFLVAMLGERGWPAKDVYSVLARHYADAAGLPIPAPPSRLESAREAFFHLLAFATLAAWIFATGSVWFDLVDHWFPDPLVDQGFRSWSFRDVSWQLASIIVAFPAFLWSTSAVLRDLLANPDKAESPIRRWLTNIALLLTALAFIGDLVAFVSSFLQGELTTRFVLKCLVVMILAGAVFLYYNRGLGKSQLLPPLAWHRMFGVTAAAAIVLSIALGIALGGRPAQIRAEREDGRRIQSIYFIENQIVSRNAANTHQPAPATLDASFGGNRFDPITRQPFEYRALDGSQFEICAAFSAPSNPALDSNPNNEFWRHPQGHRCFRFDANIQLPYPNVPQ